MCGRMANVLISAGGWGMCPQTVFVFGGISLQNVKQVGLELAASLPTSSASQVPRLQE